MGKSNVLAVVTPEEWKKRTAIRFARRTDRILTVDAAYAEYYRDRSEEKEKALHDALQHYLKVKGGSWNKVNRDKASGGLMKYMWEATASDRDPDKAYTKFEFAGRNKKDLTKDELQLLAGQNALKARIPETRHGVLYLWNKAAVDIQYGAVVLEGVLNVGGNAAKAYNQLNPNLSSTTRSDLSKLSSVGGLGSTIVQGQLEGNTVKPFIDQTGTTNTSNAQNHQVNESWIRRILGTAYHRIKKAVVDLVEGLIFKIKTSLKMAVGLSAALVKTIVMLILEIVAKAAVPFVGAAWDMGEGIVSCVRAVSNHSKAYFERKYFTVSPGHPELIATAIEQKMREAALDGYFQSLRGAAKLTFAVLSVGATAIIDAIAAGAAFAARFIQRIYEGKAIQAFLQRVREAYEKKEPSDPKRPTIAYDAERFNELFAQGCNASPCIPVLTLNSGITGDQMMFMRMFDDEDAVVTQKSFDKATSYFNRLKDFGRDYVVKSGFKFSSGDDMVQRLLFSAITKGRPDLSVDSTTATAGLGGKTATGTA